MAPAPIYSVHSWMFAAALVYSQSIFRIFHLLSSTAVPVNPQTPAALICSCPQWMPLYCTAALLQAVLPTYLQDLTPAIYNETTNVFNSRHVHMKKKNRSNLKLILISTIFIMHMYFQKKVLKIPVACFVGMTLMPLIETPYVTYGSFHKMPDTG
jgi:hypothetical protein